MAAAREGDHQAFRTLFDRYRERVFSFLMRRTGRRQNAEEAFQITWLRLWQWRARYDPSRPLRPWLFTIAANAGSDARRPTPEDFREVVELSGGTAGREARDALLSALHELSPADRRLLLFVGEGYTSQEIAAMEGLKPGTVRMRIKRARERVAERLARTPDATAPVSADASDPAESTHVP